VTDSTGMLTRLSGVYNTSRCLSITSDLYPDACGPFQLSAAAMNGVGRETTQLTLLPDAGSITNIEIAICVCQLFLSLFQKPISALAIMKKVNKSLDFGLTETVQ